MANMQSSGQEQMSPKVQRSPPFTRQELVFMVKFMDQRLYDAPWLGSAYKRKSRILRKLSQRLSEKFQSSHTPRQLQKRFSDLKTRQKKTLKTIRNQMKQESGREQAHENEEEPESEEESQNVEDPQQTLEQNTTSEFETEDLQEEDSHEPLTQVRMLGLCYFEIGTTNNTRFPSIHFYCMFYTDAAGSRSCSLKTLGSVQPV
ncbi:uncharacterized protein LOC130291908 [Hyla sarda]|uniref:uncharacterized protein LOC130291908 n=1 Tax=Hyla sarda TaxID=327740 RepID=UPI0024C21B2B|nr:uncharacterized protein LOC130291908 [Hyla sarda]